MLHASWRNKVEKAKYILFKEALEAAIQKINGYYKKTAESDAHILAMGSLNVSLVSY